MRKRYVAFAGAVGAAGAAIGALGIRAGARAVNARASHGRLRSKWADVNGLRVHMRVPIDRVSPCTVPVVLLHGAVIGSGYMIPLAVRLAPEFPVFAPDLPGHGESEAPRRRMGTEQLADFVASWLDAIGLERAALVAHSLGSQVAAQLAARHPGRVDRLVLIGPTTDAAARTSRGQLARVFGDARFERPSLWLLEANALLRAGLRLPREELASSMRDHIEDTLARVTAPTLVLRGADDPLVSREWAEQVARSARAGPPVSIPWAGHAVHHSAPEAVARAIRPFLLDGRAEPEARAVAMQMR